MTGPVIMSKLEQKLPPLLLVLVAALPEERVLNAKFGAQFSAYMHTVRRWL
jgi:protein-S-isoprenylcysteine O-methyltransferase Ste14